MRLIIFVCLIFFPLIANAQQDYQVHTHTNSRMALKSKWIMSQRWFLTNELNLRRAEVFNAPQQLTTRVAVNGFINKKLLATAGFTAAKNSPYGSNPQEIPTSEVNLWGQLQMEQQFGSIQLKHRYRYEYRFRDKIQKVPEGRDRIVGRTTAQRLRYRLTAKRILANFNNDQQLFLKAYYELFLNPSIGLEYLAFNQQRGTVLLGWRLSQAMTAEMGYMQQALKSGDNHFERNSNIVINLNYTFDFRKNN